MNHQAVYRTAPATPVLLNIRNTFFDQRSLPPPEVGGGGGVDPFFFLTLHILVKMLASQPDIRNTFFDQMSPLPPEVSVFGKSPQARKMAVREPGGRGKKL